MVTQPVTAVISSRVRAGREEEYRQIHDEIATVMKTTEGFLQSELFEAVHGLQTDTIVVFSFDSQANLNAWLHSTIRQSLVARFDPLVEGERRMNVVGGFAGWFSNTVSRPVARWKQSIAVVVGLFPTSLAITLIRNRLAPGLSLVPAILIGNIIGSFAMSYLVMPHVTKALANWLDH